VNDRCKQGGQLCEVAVRKGSTVGKDFTSLYTMTIRIDLESYSV